MGSWWANFMAPPTVGLGPLGNWLEQQVPALGQDFSQFVSSWWNSGSAVDVSGQQPPAAGGAQAQTGGSDALSQLLQQLGAGASTSGAGASNTYVTPDEVTITDGSPEDRYYRLADAVWIKIFGEHPNFSQAKVFADMGVQNTDQLQQILLQMPSHIKSPDGTPINIGTYEDMLTTSNKFAQQYFGRPVPDSLISQFVANGLTEPAAIENWFWSHPASDLPKDQYGAAWDAANQWTQQVAGAFKG